MRPLHQFLDRAVPGDSATESVLWRARLLRRLGLRSEIFARVIPRELTRAIRPLATYDAPLDVPVIFQIAGQIAGDHELAPPFPLKSTRVILTTSALAEDVTHATARLRAAQLKLGGRAVAVLSEWPPPEDASAAVHSVATPPLFDAGRLLRRSPVLPQIPVGRALVVMPTGKHLRESLALVLAAAAKVKRPVDVSVLGPAPAEVAATYRGGDLRHHPKPHPAELAGLLRRADVLLWPAGEGPAWALTALAFELPVLAAPSASARALLGEAGVAAAWPEAAPVLTELRSSRRARDGRAASQRERRAELEAAAVGALAELAETLGLRPRGLAGAPSVAPRFVVEGSFETSYSLDVTNRGLARALERLHPGQVGLFPTHGYGDYRPKADDLAQHPDLVELWRRTRRDRVPEVLIRGMYPPRVADMRGRRKLLHFAWEESNFPAEWVAEFNRSLDGLLVVSRFVRKVLIDSGVRIPIFVVGNGIDQVREATPEPVAVDLGPGFKFLHVSSAFPRKGVDVLLKAFTTAFDASDDVALVLKTFPNEHHHVERDLAELLEGIPRAPRIVLLNRDLPPGQLLDLYRRCDALVAPSRGEGFGLPMAEAMVLGLPVITTGHGGVLEFCEPESSWLVDYTFAPARSHMGLFDSVWVEPKAEDLTRVLRRVASLPPEARRRAAAQARAVVERDHTWDRVAQRVTAAVGAIEAEAIREPPAREASRIGWVSTWNARCGIAAYSARLIEHLPPEMPVQVFANDNREPGTRDEPFVTRVWTDHTLLDLSELAEGIVAGRCDVAVIHFNFGFFDVRAFGQLLQRLREREIRRVVIFHATQDRPGSTALGRISAELGRADRLLVHGVRDLNMLKGVGLVDNVALFPHGVVRTAALPREAQAAALGLRGKRVIGAYGYLRAHKGLTELVQALPAIRERHPKAHLLLVNARYPSSDSEAERKRLLEAVDVLGLHKHVTLVDKYLADGASFARLSAAELIVFPHQNTLESSSAAVRFGLSTQRPVACTPLEIFADVGDSVHRLPGVSPAELAQGISALLSDPGQLAATAERQAHWLRTHHWETVTTRLSGMLAGLCRGSVGAATGAAEARPVARARPRAR